MARMAARDRAPSGAPITGRAVDSGRRRRAPGGPRRPHQRRNEHGGCRHARHHDGPASQRARCRTSRQQARGDRTPRVLGHLGRDGEPLRLLDEAAQGRASGGAARTRSDVSFEPRVAELARHVLGQDPLGGTTIPAALQENAKVTHHLIPRRPLLRTYAGACVPRAGAATQYLAEPQGPGRRRRRAGPRDRTA